MRRISKAHGKSRTTGYRITGPVNEAETERILSRAKAAGVVTEYDTGRGLLVWFNGPPGATLREVRDAVRALAGVVA